MTYTLAIGDRIYSSWSLRGWLLFANFGLSVQLREARLYTDEIGKVLADFGGARLVPAVRSNDGLVVWDSLAIAETLAERHPAAGHWPADPALRALARSMCAEMHSGFQALRSACPMNLEYRFVGFAASEAVRKDLDRIELIWRLARQNSDADGPWLFGDYCAADAFYAPVASRIATYGLQVGAAAQAYATAHLADDRFREWRTAGLANFVAQPSYAMDLPTVAWED